MVSLPFPPPLEKYPTRMAVTALWFTRVGDCPVSSGTYAGVAGRWGPLLVVGGQLARLSIT